MDERVYEACGECDGVGCARCDHTGRVEVPPAIVEERRRVEREALLDEYRRRVVGIIEEHEATSYGAARRLLRKVRRDISATDHLEHLACVGRVRVP